MTGVQTCALPISMLQEGLPYYHKLYPEVIYSAYTVAELGEILPICADSGKTSKFNTEWNCRYIHNDDECKYIYADTEANARAKMLCYLKEKGLL